MNSIDVTFVVNGQPIAIAVPPNLMLADLLRDRLGLAGCRIGCDQAVCGACVVLMDGAPVAACTRLAATADGTDIVTIEGISDGASLHPVQLAFLRSGGLQCGFCSAGMILSTIALLARHPAPDEDTIRDWMGGHLCRCTGYRQIIDAVGLAAELLRQ